LLLFRSGSKLPRAEACIKASKSAATAGFGNLVTLTEDYDL
jgi:hypothetical protein